MYGGYVRIYRKILENPIWTNAKLLQIWIWCLLKANHRANTFIWNGEIMTLREGEFITGRDTGSKEVGLSPSGFYKNIQLLEKFSYISVNSNNRFTHITIINWAKYQGRLDNGNNKRTTKEQQKDTNNNEKNEKNEKKNIRLV